MSFENDVKIGDICRQETLEDLSRFAFFAANHFKRGCIEAAKNGNTTFSQKAGDVDNTYYSYSQDFELSESTQFFFDAAFTSICRTPIGRYGGFENTYDEEFVSLLELELRKLDIRNVSISKRFLYATKKIEKKNRFKSFLMGKEVFDSETVLVGRIALFYISTAWN